MHPLRTALVIDDDESARILARRTLEVLGFQVTTSPSAAQAFKVLEHSSFSIILLDLLMPEIDGFEALRRIRERGVTVPIIAFTAMSIEPFGAGFDGIIPKPASPDDYTVAIRNVLAPMPA